MKNNRKKNRMIDLLKKTLKVPLKFHWSALILPLLFVINSGPVGLLYWVMLLACLLFHEYGHVYEAIRQGIEPKHVIVHAFGGFAALGKMNLAEPQKEAYMAVAGPLASFFLASLTLPFLIFAVNSYVILFLIFNVAICFFNLIPAYPLDGGRILNGILASFVGYRKAINISTIVSYVLSGCGFIFSLMNGAIWLAMISGLVAYLAYRSKQGIGRQLDAIGYD